MLAIRKFRGLLGLVILIFLLSLSLPISQALAQVSVLVNPAMVKIDETVTLTISLGSSSVDMVDLSVLKNDFKILKKTKTSSIQVEQGKTQIKKNLVLVLLPLKTGKVKIPSITIGNEITTPLSIQVNEKSLGNLREKHSRDEDVFVEVETDLTEMYVQGQLVVTQKIFHAIPLKTASLDPPTVKNEAAEMVSLSKTDTYFWTFNNKRYHVIERSYALFPKYSGTLQIEAAEFVGQAETARKNDPFSLLTGASTFKQVKTIAPAVVIKVLPQDEGFSKDVWLPAKNITLYSKWSKSVNEIEADEPVTLSLGIIADGLRAEQLPDIKLDIPTHVKAYYEQPELNNRATLTGITGVWSQNVSLIPSQQEESLTIPSFELPWWNVITGGQEIAQLSAQEFKVKGASAGLNRLNQEPSREKNPESSQHASLERNIDQEPELSDAQLKSEKVGETNKAVAIGSKQNIPVVQNDLATEKPNSSIWRNILLLALVMGILAVAFIVRKILTNTNSQRNSSSTDATNKNQQILQALKSACIANDSKQVEKLLPQWAKHIARIRPYTLVGISKANDGYLQAEMEQLSQSLYGSSSVSWKGVHLWSLIKNYPLTNAVSRDPYAERLEKMYPFVE